MSSTLQVGDFTANSGQVVVGSGSDAEPTQVGSTFSGDLGITFVIYNDDSRYLYSDDQGVLDVAYTPSDPDGAPYTLQAGVSFVITFDFASPSAQTIDDFEFVQGTSFLSDGFISQFDAATSTLTLTSTEEIDIPAGSTNLLEGHFLSAIPEPSDFALIAGVASLVFIVVRRRLPGIRR